jgi:MFS family permease
MYVVIPYVDTDEDSFYNQMGLGELTFTYTVIAQAMGMVATLIGILATDHYGRRPPIIIGAAGSVMFNFLIAGLGSKPDPSKAAIDTVIASVILLLAANKVSFQCNSCESWSSEPCDGGC